MNFKHLFPSFRNRFRFVRNEVARYARQQEVNLALNLGTGEGDYDRMLAEYTRELIGCDVNAEDIAYAAQLNKGVLNLRYETNDALQLSYPDGHFDLIVSSEVIEHVGQPARMMQEIARVLAPSGVVVMTFPSREFPFTYDPVNRIGQWLGTPSDREYVISQGAYAFGHEYLIGSADFKRWADEAGLEIVLFRPLSGWLVGLAEMYWTGLAQSIFKKNARNVTADTAGALKVRPADTSEPALAALTDAFLGIDRLLSLSSNSLGKGVVLRKKT